MPKSISNPYPFKKIGFYPYPYPLSSQRIFLLFDHIGSGRKSTDTDTFAISRQEYVEREVDRAEGSNQLPTDGGSEMQAIVIPGFPEMGSNDQSGPEDFTRGEPREGTSIPPALQMIHPPNWSESCPGIAKLALAGRKRPLPPD